MPTRWFWPTLFFWGGWLLLSSPWLFGDLTIPYDAKAHFQAQMQFLAHSLHTGQSPFWTPNVFAGSPQIADPQSLIFSPALILALIFPEPSFLVLDAYVIALLACGGLAALYFALDRGWHPAAGLVAAFVFAFGASAAWRIQHVGQIQSYCFFAIALFLLARALDRKSWPYGLAAGFFIALTVVSPNQVAYLAALFIAAYVINHWVSGGTFKAIVANVRETFAPVAVAALSCLLFSAVPLILTILFVDASNRPEVNMQEAMLGSLHPATMLTLVASDLFGALSRSVSYWGPSSAQWAAKETNLAQNMAQLYLGALPALALIAALLSGRNILNRDVRIFVLGLGFFFLYALGHYTPVFETLFHYLPGVSGFRRPADATFMIGAMAAMVAAFSVDQLLRAPSMRIEGRMLATILVIVAALLVACTGLAIHFNRLGDAAEPIITSALWIVAGLVVLGTAYRFRNMTAVATGLVAAFFVADLYANNGPNESTAEPQLAYEILNPNCKNPTVGFLKRKVREASMGAYKPRVEFAGLGFNWPNVGLVQGFENVFGYNPLRLADFNAATGAPDTISAPEERQFTPLFPSYRSNFANLIGLRYIVSKVQINQIDKNLKPGDLNLIGVTDEAFIYENPRALPRAMFVDRAVIGDFEAMTKTGEWPEGFNPEREFVIDVNDTDGIEEFIRKEGVPAKAAVMIRAYENTRVEIEVEADGDGFVLLNDAWHPWWRASIDGVEVPILRANVMFRAVPVTAGKHTIHFEFRPIEGAIAELAAKLDDNAD
ncbi:hypothetical protein KIH24_08715 [Rhizobiales bacterium TNE-4]|nr:hypothetical protein [Rhizobiales bacterium TNE-4]MBV1827705.1 YfhO family protein [Rhizobiales bacterium TNE-4]